MIVEYSLAGGPKLLPLLAHVFVGEPDSTSPEHAPGCERDLGLHVGAFFAGWIDAAEAMRAVRVHPP